MFLLRFLLLCAPLAACSSGDQDCEASTLPVVVDPAVELVCTIYRLAQMPQYDWNELPAYIDELDEHFAPFRDHPAVKLARELRKTHRINGSAPVALALYLTAPPELMGRIPLSPPPADLDPRWTEDAISRFLEAARGFSRDTDFPEFLASKRRYHEKSVEILRKSLAGHEIVPWLQDYFGQEADAYAVIVGMQCGKGNYGMQRTRPDGSAEFVSVIGAAFPSRWTGIPRFHESWLIRTVLHEFSHPFVNPLVDRNAAVLEEIASKLHTILREDMMQQGYSTWQHLCYEYVVRAVVLRYLQQRNDNEGVARLLSKNEEQGFPATERLAKLLVEYEADRERHPTLEGFLSRIAACLEEIRMARDGSG